MGQPLYIALDPGGTTGYATFDGSGKFLDMEYLDLAEVRNRFELDLWDAIAVICENWKLDPKLAKVFAWSEMPTCKLIGWLEGVCWMKNIPFILQEPQAKRNGYKQAGKTPLPKSNPMNHALDAYIHGRIYLVKNGLILP
jgi:hypothetical protein